MVKDAETFKDEDEAQAARISAKNQLELIVYGTRSKLEENRDKLSEDERFKS